MFYLATTSMVPRFGARLPRRVCPCCNFIEVFYTVWAQSLLGYKMSAPTYTVRGACCYLSRWKCC